MAGKAGGDSNLHADAWAVILDRNKTGGSEGAPAEADLSLPDRRRDHARSFMIETLIYSKDRMLWAQSSNV